MNKRKLKEAIREVLNENRPQPIPHPTVAPPVADIYFEDNTTTATEIAETLESSFLLGIYSSRS